MAVGASSSRRGTRAVGTARIICFECYRARLDQPERLPVFVIPFPRLLGERELAHRRRMLSHLAASGAAGTSTTA